jgi:hypothetical protein
MRCYHCRHHLTDDAQIFRVSLGRSQWTRALGIIRYLCHDCANPLGLGKKWQSPVACTGCGRRVIHDTNRKSPLFPICGEEACRRAAVAASARERRRGRPPSVTCVCGTKFAPTRTDARYCSSACRQRAYRKRLASIGGIRGAQALPHAALPD